MPLEQVDEPSIKRTSRYVERRGGQMPSGRGNGGNKRFRKRNDSNRKKAAHEHEAFLPFFRVCDSFSTRYGDAQQDTCTVTTVKALRQPIRAACVNQ